MIVLGLVIVAYVALSIIVSFVKYGDTIQTTPVGQGIAALLNGTLAAAILLLGHEHIGAWFMAAYFGFNFIGTAFMVGRKVTIDTAHVFVSLVFGALLLWGTFTVFI